LIYDYKQETEGKTGIVVWWEVKSIKSRPQVEVDIQQSYALASPFSVFPLGIRLQHKRYRRQCSSSASGSQFGRASRQSYRMPTRGSGMLQFWKMV
jgi:hypothetical protein